MDNIEALKKILYEYDWENNPKHLIIEATTVTHQIDDYYRQLLPKTEDNPDGFEPKPSESRLLSPEEINKVIDGLKPEWTAGLERRALLEAQRDLTASSVRRETAERIKREESETGIKSVITYLKNEIVTQDKRTAGKPKLKAHLNAVERCVLQTVINALEEGVK